MKTFIVLGMARSATSLIAKSLHDLGVHMGDRLSNLYEDPDFRAMDIAILKAAGGKGDDPGHIPPSPEAILAVRNQFDDRIAALVARKSQRPLWGWKNPRTCLTAPLYHPHLTHPHYVPIFREPIEAAKSLHRFLGWDVERGLALGRIYNARILAFVREFVGLEEENG